jgi:lipopolysaccharide/colanic/teichoic acid biosynthesis glycosyltransferase
MIRFFDLFFSLIGLIFLTPLFIFVSVWIKLDSKGSIFYKQKRVGKNDKDFNLYKFRSMYDEADKKGLLTIGMNDYRITNVGCTLRKYKLDELPQLINVFIGDMSIVGPRPEVRKYVNLYSDAQRNILKERPGITDYASIIYSNENEILLNKPNPEEFYIKYILPRKIKLNMIFIKNKSLINYFRIIILTIFFNR